MADLNRPAPGLTTATLNDTARNGRRILTLVGELDLATAPQLDDAVTELSADGATEVVLDLSRLAFIDSTGLRAILAARAACEKRGCAFVLTRGTEPVQRLFDLTGMSDDLAFMGSAAPAADERQLDLAD